MPKNQSKHTSPEIGIGFGVVLILFSIVVFLLPGAREVATKGWAGALGMPIWIVCIPVLLLGIWCIYEGRRQQKMK
jgi:hypothetical protein